MKRVKLEVAYDGTNYCGWQIQPNAITVEEVLNKTLSSLLGEEITVIGASRTDSGVHAIGNVAVFDTNTKIPSEKISYAVNQRLPEDIKVQKSMDVPDDFHPRHCNCTKTYEYNILNTTHRIPTYRFNTHFVYQSLDVERMREASMYLVGEHDFKSFCSIHTQVKETVRTIYSIEIIPQNPIVTIRICGNGFLYNMVRIIAGTLIQVGMGMIEPKQVSTILMQKDRSYAGPTAPAKGLTLVKIQYLSET